MSRLKKLNRAYKKNPMKAFQKQQRRQLVKGGRLAAIRPAAAEEAKRDKRTKELVKKQVEKTVAKNKITKPKPKPKPKPRSNKPDLSKPKFDPKPLDTTYKPKKVKSADPAPKSVSPKPVDTQPEVNVEDLMATELADLKTMFSDSLATQMDIQKQMQEAQAAKILSLQEQMMLDREAQAAAMSQYQQDLATQQQVYQQQLMAAQQLKPQTAGVEMAQSAAGTPMQIARRGVTGAFNRAGMRISSLNI
jgi:hypothetical protein